MLKQLSDKIKQIKWRALIYPAISLVFFALLIILFIMQARFIFQSTDKALTLNETNIEAKLARLDMENFNIVARKLGIPIQKEAPAMPAATAETVKEAVKSAATTSVSGSPLQKDKTSIKIAVYNSTETGGLATKLKKELAAEGFTISKTGDKKPLQKITLIQVKKEMSDSAFVKEISGAVSRVYSPKTEVLDASSAFDIVIIIGAK